MNTRERGGKKTEFPSKGSISVRVTLFVRTDAQRCFRLELSSSSPKLRSKVELEVSIFFSLSLSHPRTSDRSAAINRVAAETVNH